MAAQLSDTMAASRRVLSECSARATSSLPVPDSPWMRTVESVGATLPMRSNTSRMASLVPIISGVVAPATDLAMVRAGLRRARGCDFSAAYTAARRASAA